MSAIQIPIIYTTSMSFGCSQSHTILKAYIAVEDIAEEKTTTHTKSHVKIASIYLMLTVVPESILSDSNCLLFHL